MLTRDLCRRLRTVAIIRVARWRWFEAADGIERGVAKTIQQKKVTYDLERQMAGATKVKTSEFAKYIVENI